MTPCASRRLAGVGSGVDGPELVLIHGWGFDSSVWQPWLDALTRLGPVTLVDLPGFGASTGCEALEDVYPSLMAALPERCVLIGWSLGGMLAVELAARYPKRCLAVVTLAANACFVARPDWPQAMDRATFRAFQTQCRAEPETTWRRFLGLCVQGAAQPRQLTRQLRQLQPNAPTPAALNRGLEWLRQLDTRASLTALQCPAAHWLAEQDALVPVTVTEPLQKTAIGHRFIQMEACHCLWLEHPQQLAYQLQAFLADQGILATTPSKRAVAGSFSRAATSYDDEAALQCAVCERLLTMRGSGFQGFWLDLGCGTGAAIPALQDASEQLLALDLAPGMLDVARHRYGAEVFWVGGDAEQLPLAADCLDGVFSSLAIQWCGDLAGALSELNRVLKPGGQALISTLGPRSLRSLRAAWASVDQEIHVNRFAGRDELREQARQAGLVVSSWEEEEEVVYYPNVLTLARAMKALGTYNINPGRRAGLGGRQRLAALERAMDTFRADAGLPVEYQVWYLMLIKP